MRDILQKVRDKVLVSTIYLKELQSHAGFWLVPKLVTFNDLERRNDPQSTLSLR